MPHERYVIPGTTLPDGQVDFLIANEHGEEVNRISLAGPPGEQIEPVELVLPQNYDTPLIGMDQAAVTVPNPLGTIIQKDTDGTLVLAGGFDPTLSDAVASEMVTAHVEFHANMEAEQEAAEREREEAIRERDREEIRESPNEFLWRKIEERDDASWDDACLLVLSIIEDPYVQAIKGDVNLYTILADIARELRLGGDPQTDYLELNAENREKLLGQLTRALDNTNAKERRGIYDVIGQVDVSIEEQEKLLWRMEEKNDYRCNPLAARYALNQYKHNEEGQWVGAQTERQERLRQLVDCSPEVAMDNFDESMRLAHKIVFSSNPSKMPEGKVGMELEGKVWYRDVPVPLSDEWNIGYDGPATEIRKAIDKLALSSYPSALVELYSWAENNFVADARDSYAVHLSRTMHIHLDYNLHPEKPLYGLFDDQTHENDWGTWEIRGVMPFQSSAETLAFVELAVRSSYGNENWQPAKQLSTKNILQWQKLLYGRIVYSSNDINARVAALVALRDPFAMRGFDIEPLVETYGKEVLELLYEQQENFLVADSIDYQNDLYEQSCLHDTSRNPQKLYDVAMAYYEADPHWDDLKMRIAFAGMGPDLYAHDFLIGIMESSNTSKKGWMPYVQELIAESIENTTLENGLRLLPILLNVKNVLTDFSRDALAKELMRHKEIEAILLAELQKEELLLSMRYRIERWTTKETL